MGMGLRWEGDLGELIDRINHLGKWSAHNKLATELPICWPPFILIGGQSYSY